MSSVSDLDDETTRGLAVAPRHHAATGQSEEARPSLDRYILLEQVGAGGMGVVHRAYDPKLRREVALKMLRFDRREGSGAMRAETRILREARAMAQLSHPNVLPVYDVEQVSGLVYIAMEYVDGQNLSRWMRKQKPRWREIVEVFRQAGAGLHAAHQTGIIHRDFKPANVLMGNRGRILVTDFGLARAHDEEEQRQPDGWSSSGGNDNDTITAEGEVVGTPAYMAPEQLRGDPIDARADQYAFCIALYEGLYGHRPFPYRDPLRLLEAKEAEEYEFDATPQIPAWLQRIVERGLRPSPADRFPSMGELLAALGHDPAHARRRWVWGATGAALGVGAIGLLLATGSEDDPCPDADGLAEQLLGEARRTQVREALLATELAYAAETAERVDARLRSYARAWAEGQVDACEATRVRGEQSAEAFDLRTACLRRHRAELEATVETLTGTLSDRTLMGAAGMVAALPPLSECTDVAALRARGRPTDPAVSAELEQLGERLARARAFSRAGRSDEARAIIDEIEDRATVLRDPMLHGEAMLLHGELAENARSSRDAGRWFELAYADAVEARNAPLAIASSTVLIHWLGAQQARTAEAEQWIVQARAWLRGREEHDPLRARLAVAEGELYQVAGRLDEARAAFERAVELLEHQGTEASERVQTHHTLGLAFMALGDPQAAHDHFVATLELRRELLGSNHPEVGRAHQNLGAALYASGQLAPALPQFERALEILEQAYGPEHPKVATVLGNLGSVRDDLGDYDDARECFERALRIMDASEGTGSTERVALLGNLSDALRHLGDHTAAAQHLRTAAALVAEAHGPEHPEHVFLLTRLGEVLIDAEQTDEALEVLERADHLRRGLSGEAALISADAARHLGHLLALRGDLTRGLPLLSEAVVLYRDLGGELDPRRGLALLALGEARLDAGDATAARAALEDAIPLLAKRQDDRHELAQARFALARALTTDAPDERARTRARRLAQDAISGLDLDDPARRRIQQWLAATG